MRIRVTIGILLLCVSVSGQVRTVQNGAVRTIRNGAVVGKVYVDGTTNIADTIKFTSVQPATLNQVSITFNTLAVTDTIYLDWGEDAVVKVSGTTDQVKTSDYSTINKTYTIKVYGNLSKLGKFIIAFEATVQGIKSSELSKCINLTYLNLNNLGTTGHTINTADLVGMPLTYLQLSTLGTTGHTINTANLVGMQLTYLSLTTLGTTGHTINTANLVGMPLTALSLTNLGTTGHTINTADLVGMPLTVLQLSTLGTTGHTINTANLVGMQLTYLSLNNLGTTSIGQISDLATGLTTMAITNCGTGISITSGTMKAWTNTVITLTPSGTGYTTAQIDGFLNAWATPAGAGTKTIDLRGANQARSSASDAAVSTLTTKGKTILTNP